VNAGPLGFSANANLNDPGFYSAQTYEGPTYYVSDAPSSYTKTPSETVYWSNSDKKRR
jgi:hypothetical protein